MLLKRLTIIAFYLLSTVRGLALNIDHEPIDLPLDAVSNQLEPRAVCKRADDPITTIVSNAASFSSADAQIILGTGTAVLFTCRILRGVNGNDPDQSACFNYAGAVLGTVAAVNGLVAKTRGGTGETAADAGTPNPPVPPTRREDDGDIPFHEEYAAHMSEYGVVWDDMQILPNPQNRISTSSNTTGVVNRISMLGIRGNDTDADTDERYDHLITTYSDGTGSVRLTYSSSASETKKLARRHDGPGFKFNFRRFDLNSNFLGDPDQTVMGSSLDGMPAKIARDLGRLAFTNPTADGFVWVIAVDGVYSFAMSVLAEVQGFGDEYEDVNVCGDMSGPAHDVFVAHSA